MNKYSIRRFTVGTASILVGSTLLFGIGNEAHAAEEHQKSNTTENVADSNASEAPTKEEAPSNEATSEAPTKEEAPSNEATSEAPTKKKRQAMKQQVRHQQKKKRQQLKKQTKQQKKHQN